jgi:hypothetical protein
MIIAEQLGVTALSEGRIPALSRFYDGRSMSFLQLSYCGNSLIAHLKTWTDSLQPSATQSC